MCVSIVYLIKLIRLVFVGSPLHDSTANLATTPIGKRRLLQSNDWIGSYREATGNRIKRICAPHLYEPSSNLPRLPALLKPFPLGLDMDALRQLLQTFYPCNSPVNDRSAKQQQQQQQQRQDQDAKNSRPLEPITYTPIPPPSSLFTSLCDLQGRLSSSLASSCQRQFNRTWQFPFPLRDGAERRDTYVPPKSSRCHNFSISALTSEGRDAET